MTADPVRAIADAVLYEGYILWPYRRSAMKNQQRFTFGGVYPPAHSHAHPDDRALTQTQVLVCGDQGTLIQVTVRFLQVVRRQVFRGQGTGSEEVEELLTGGDRHVPWEEATEREFTIGATFEQLRNGLRLPVAVKAGREREPIGDEGEFVRSWRDLHGELRLRAHPLSPELWRLGATVVNLTNVSEGASRRRILEQTLCSTHLLLKAGGGVFVSATDPPEELAGAVARCTNIGSWPVLVGEPGDATMMLSSPIILEDYPRVAPESPGDLFDGGEIDQLLILSILAMTDEERAEMRAADPRAREILERTEALTPEQLMALHGAVREFGMAR